MSKLSTDNRLNQRLSSTEIRVYHGQLNQSTNHRYTSNWFVDLNAEEWDGIRRHFVFPFPLLKVGTHFIPVPEENYSVKERFSHFPIRRKKSIPSHPFEHKQNSDGAEAVGPPNLIYCSYIGFNDKPQQTPQGMDMAQQMAANRKKVSVKSISTNGTE